MNDRQLTVPLPGSGSAVLNLPRPMTPEILLELERLLATTRCRLQLEAAGGADEAGQIEYDSWLTQLRPGAAFR